MSQDLSCTNTRCDHFQLMERYVLDAFDFQTLHYAPEPYLNMRAPINGRSTVRIYVAGELVSPTDPTWGYSIVPDPLRVLTGYTFYKIMLNNRVRMLNPLIEVCYSTREGFCLKCAATGVLHDWETNGSAGFKMTSGVEKMAQQCLKYILTSRNPFNQDLVCPIKTYIGAEFGVTVTSDDISSAILTILARYQSIQASQRTIQALDLSELLKDVVSVAAVQDTTDPTVVNVAVSVDGYGSEDPVALSVNLKGSNS